MPGPGLQGGSNCVRVEKFVEGVAIEERRALGIDPRDGVFQSEDLAGVVEDLSNPEVVGVPCAELSTQGVDDSPDPGLARCESVQHIGRRCAAARDLE